MKLTPLKQTLILFVLSVAIAGCASPGEKQGIEQGVDAIKSSPGTINNQTLLTNTGESKNQPTTPTNSKLESQPAKQSTAAPEHQVKTSNSMSPGSNYPTQLMLAQTLLTESSIAKQIMASADSQAIDLHDEAKAYFDRARKASEAGDKAAAKEHINKAKKLMFQAAKQVGNKNSKAKHAQGQYDKRYKNVETLLEALGRVSKEKGLQQDTEETQQLIKQKMQQSQQAKAQGDIKKAKDIIDGAFVLAKLNIIKLRDGDTLVRSLNFANKEEEYAYEIDRNDTHKMLVNLLLNERLKNPVTAAKVNKNMDKAATLRRQAEKYADQGNFEKAITTLENATKQIVRAIRAAGVYIPG